MADDHHIYDKAATDVVALGNRIAESDEQADLWAIADGVLAGAVHYWLYSRQPCGDPMCADCEPIGTAEERLAELLRFIEQSARDSDYYHTANDLNVGRA